MEMSQRSLSGSTMERDVIRDIKLGYKES
jgi:hypothetical protein